MAKKIPLLAIDDDTEFLELVGYTLELAGFKVYKASNGPAALHIARSIDLSVILLDTVMPGMDGLQVLSELKLDDKTKNIPVIMLTAKSVMGDVEYAFDIGADDYITKPVVIRDLPAKIKTKLKNLSKTHS